MAQHSAQDDVVVTGIGAVTPIGTGAKELWAGAMRGRSAVAPITRFDPSPFTSHIAAEINDFDPTDYLDAKQVRRLDRFSQFAVASAQMALDDAQLSPGSVLPERVGVCLGTALGGISYAEKEHEAYLSGGIKAVSPLLALAIFAGAGACNIAIEFGFTGPTTANGDSCASAPVALGNAMNYLKRGECDVVLAGASEAPLAPMIYGAFALIRSMSTRNDDPKTSSRPFDKNRDGFVMAEGSAVLVLETRAHAEKRGAPTYAVLGGCATTNDGQHMTAPRGDGACSSRAMRQAIAQAGLTPTEIMAISAHGSSTPLNDSAETRAIKLAFGEEWARQIPVFGTKGMHGHALGATGAFEAALCCLAMKNKMVPPSINIETSDPDCDLDYVTDGPRAWSPGPILSNSFGFGGINSCLVFKPGE